MHIPSRFSSGLRMIISDFVAAVAPGGDGGDGTYVKNAGPRRFIASVKSLSSRVITRYSADSTGVASFEASADKLTKNRWPRVSRADSRQPGFTIARRQMVGRPYRKTASRHKIS